PSIFIFTLSLHDALPIYTTWLECTSQDFPYGYLGDFTDDRLVLAMTENGGKILRTVSYPYDQSIQHRKGSFKLNTDGKISGVITDRKSTRLNSSHVKISY